MDQKKVLTRDAILNAADIQTEAVEVPEWGGTVYVRALTGVERDEYEGSRVSVKGKKVELNYKNTRAKLVALCAVDEQGSRLFTEEDVPALGRRNAAALNRVFLVAQRLSALGPEDVEDAEKNS